ncbi:TPA: DUF2513 domain-containing protein [Serratia marcescens]|nr:DUF2513 domain-containing protein [Serratia marcescens]
MKINQQYLKDLLIAFEDTEGPDTFVEELKGYEINSENFIFHMRLLDDNKLVTRVDGEPGLGHLFRQHMNGYDYRWLNTPLRLTSHGHDFIDALKQKDVWNSVKTEFKDVTSIRSLIKITKSLATGFAKKKIKDLTGFDAD